ncbi:MAG: hypothetical protein M3O70_14880 [Actinomycetota bacterium]|nr:hypothetical protein [Actinomycetota bacterium]
MRPTVKAMPVRTFMGVGIAVAMLRIGIGCRGNVDSRQPPDVRLGEIVVEPTSAVGEAEPPCGEPSRPIKAEAIVVRDGFLWFEGKEAACGKTNEQEEFLIGVPPGKYVVRAAAERAEDDEECGAQSVTVSADEFARVWVESTV